MTATEQEVLIELALVGFTVIMVFRQMALFAILTGILAHNGRGRINPGWWLHLVVTALAVTGVIVYYGR